MFKFIVSITILLYFNDSFSTRDPNPPGCTSNTTSTPPTGTFEIFHNTNHFLHGGKIVINDVTPTETDLEKKMYTVFISDGPQRDRNSQSKPTMGVCFGKVAKNRGIPDTGGKLSCVKSANEVMTIAPVSHSFCNTSFRLNQANSCPFGYKEPICFEIIEEISGGPGSGNGTAGNTGGD